MTYRRDGKKLIDPDGKNLREVLQIDPCDLPWLQRPGADVRELQILRILRAEGHQPGGEIFDWLAEHKITQLDGLKRAMRYSTPHRVRCSFLFCNAPIGFLITYIFPLFDKNSIKAVELYVFYLHKDRIREADTMLIAIDHGNKLVKIPNHASFTSGLQESDTPPFGAVRYLEWRRAVPPESAEAPQADWQT